MARTAQSRNLFGFGKRKPARRKKAAAKRSAFGWLTRKKETYHRDVAKERSQLRTAALEDRRTRVELKKLKAQERAADAAIAQSERKIAAAERKLETAEKKADRGAMPEAQFQAMKARMEAEIEKQKQHKAAILAKNPGCANTRKGKVSDRAKRYRANQPGCKPSGVKKCKLCGSRSDLMIDHADGNESNGRKSNLRWLCRSCNNTLGAEMARTGQGRRTVQYNPAHKGAQTLGEYIQAVLQHTRGAHDDAGRIIHDTPKSRRRQFASEIWASRHAHGTARPGSESAGYEYDNPSRSIYYSLAIFDGVSRLGGRNEFTAPTLQAAQEKAQSYADDMGYDAVLYDVGGKSLGRFTTSRALSNPISDDQWTVAKEHRIISLGKQLKHATPQERIKIEQEMSRLTDQVTRHKVEARRRSKASNPTALANPETDSEEYRQAKRIAELFHGRPVKEEIEVTDEIRSHDWYAYIGPLVELRVKALKGSPFRTAKFRFNLKGDAAVNLLTSPDGRQFYLRGGDQEIDLDSLGMGENSDWYRDHMAIGLVTYIAYLDRKKFHGFKLTEFYHKIGSTLDESGTNHIQKTNVKPLLAYDTLSHKLRIVGGLQKVEVDQLVDDMSPGIVL